MLKRGGSFWLITFRVHVRSSYWVRLRALKFEKTSAAVSFVGMVEMATREERWLRLWLWLMNAS